ncbi:hypothetical protein Tmar_1932 [Thermaerobacter marianensis DSM 12885]|uniref:Uncharacterized protein n=1 Tax=Thermaerobacter marianensis (strain ATCC 700841 / DSM 12885 / JCM 10246 / 7p75a) TaxID=644966 RepID=E6SIS3_THEM7|nr:hypothetical protein [Thermaerobacter marianensis]ADU52017.1 hypothetical protein Tmar_1932 [Thermaerobacter marianensis DSM 12885]
MVFAVSVFALSHRMAPATARRWGWAAVAAVAARESGRAAGSRLLAVLAVMWVAVSLGLVTVVPAMAGVQELVLEFALALLAYRWAVRARHSRVG